MDIHETLALEMKGVIAHRKSYSQTINLSGYPAGNVHGVIGWPSVTLPKL